jgi:hypothetical protein
MNTEKTESSRSKDKTARAAETIACGPKVAQWRLKAEIRMLRREVERLKADNAELRAEVERKMDRFVERAPKFITYEEVIRFKKEERDAILRAEAEEALLRAESKKEKENG